MDWRYNTIWFEQIPAEDQINWDFKAKGSELNIGDKEYAILWHYKQKGVSFSSIPQSDKLLYLELNWANVKDFSGIERLPNLKRLELHSCIKLENDLGLSVLENMLEFLQINTSKKLQSVDEISKLRNLKTLRLNNCGPLKSLDFLRKLPHLIDFRFVDTNVLDGDLSPIIEHPTLRSVGFFNKRHYNHTRKEIDSLLDLKSNKEYMDFVYKGKYETFKYK